MKNNPPPEIIMDHLNSCVEQVVENRPCYVFDPVSDMTRNRKLGLKQTLYLTLHMSDRDNRAEIHTWFKTPDPPTDSALIQQRSKIRPEAFSRIYHQLTLPFEDRMKTFCGYRLFSFDGCAIRFYPNPKNSRCLIRTGCDQPDQGQFHLDVLYDTLNHLFYAERISCGSKIEETGSLVQILESRELPSNSLVMADRNFESWNLFATFMECGQKFLIRIKDLHHKGGLLENVQAPADEFDIDLHYHLYRSQSLAAKADPLFKFLSSPAKSGYLQGWQDGYYDMTLRIVRIRVEQPQEKKSHYISFATNLDRDPFSPGQIKEMYPLRWSQEKGFYQLKHPLHMIQFHSRKDVLVLQEIYASLIVHNLVSLFFLLIKRKKTDQYHWHPDFSTAAVDLRLCLKNEISAQVLLLRMEKCLVPYRPGRKAPRKVKPQGPQPFNGK